MHVLIHGNEACSGVLPPQERTGVKMVMIQDGPLPTGADKPLRITGDPFKVQVGEKPRIGWVLGVGVALGRNMWSLRVTQEVVTLDVPLR